MICGTKNQALLSKTRLKVLQRYFVSATMAQVVTKGNKNRDVSLADRKVIYYLIVGSMKEGDVEVGTFTKTAKIIGFPARTISKVWCETS